MDQPWLCCLRRGAAAVSCGITTAWLILVDAQGFLPALGSVSLCFTLFVSPGLCELVPSHPGNGVCLARGTGALVLQQRNPHSALGTWKLGRGWFRTRV